MKQGFETLSISIPCRNESAHIESCLRSILAQQIGTRELEIIVVDGMSNDGTRGILRASAAKDSRLRLVDTPSYFSSQK